jgi:hypothetical protein
MYSQNLRSLIYFMIATSLPLDRKPKPVRKFGRTGRYLRKRLPERERERERRSCR